MILHRQDPAVEMLTQLGEPLFLVDTNPTAENIAKLIFDFAAGEGFPDHRSRSVGNAALLRHVSQIAVRLKPAGRGTLQDRRSEVGK